MSSVEFSSPISTSNHTPPVADNNNTTVTINPLPVLHEHKEPAVNSLNSTSSINYSPPLADTNSTQPPYFRNASTALLLSNTNGWNSSITRPDTYDEVDEGKIALLLSAASKDNVDRVLAIIRSGLDPSAHNDDKRTALHVAASDGSINVVQLLLEEGVDINAKDRFGHTPLDDSIRSGNKEITDILRYYHAQHGSIEKLEARLIQACADGNLADVETLLTSGVQPNCADYDARTPLHLAVAEGNLEICKLLLAKGANPKAEDRWGSSPLSELQRRLARTGKDPMQEVFEEYIEKVTPSLFSPFVVLYAGWELIMIILLGLFARYGIDSEGNVPAANGQDTFNNHYPMYMDVHVMIFIGFGYLMVFLRKHGYTSVGVTFLVGAMVIQWYQLTHGFWTDLFSNTFNKIELTISSFIQADFCVGAVLITFGVILGKVSPNQMLFISLIETLFYSLNETIGIYLDISDLGGTMTIHMFGAFFGLAVSLMITPSTSRGNQNNSAVYHSDIFAMLGTIFLWMYWPSFNGAQGKGNTQARAVINTVLSLSASCVMAFIASYMLRREKKFAMVDIQNATLAGGVAMGACADLLILPGSAVAIGSIAGTLSVVGFVYIQPYLEQKIGLQDTCGVNNLHGMPSILGAFAAVIAASQGSESIYGEQLTVSWPSRLSRTAQSQAGYQVAYIGTTIGIAILSGIFAGICANNWLFDPIKPVESSEKNFFNDSEWWEVPHLEIPYFFDERGEISRGAGNLPLINPGLVETSRNDKEADGMNDIRLKARYQKMLETKLSALEDQVRVLKKQTRMNTGNSAQQPYYPYYPYSNNSQAPHPPATVTHPSQYQQAQPIPPPSSINEKPVNSSFHPASTSPTPYPSNFLSNRAQSIDSASAPYHRPYGERSFVGGAGYESGPPGFNRMPSINTPASVTAANAGTALANQQRMEVLLQKLINKIDKIK